MGTFNGWIVTMVLADWTDSNRAPDAVCLIVARIDLHKLLPLLGQHVLGENRLNGTSRFTGAAIDAFIGIREARAR